MKVVATATCVAQGPPPELRFRRRVRPVAAVRELWCSREVLRALAERDLRARYKQAVLGAGWAIITPLLLMAVFSVVFTRVAKVDTGGVPYPLFSYVALLPWTFFGTSVSQGSSSIISSTNLLNKVSFPREVFPVATTMVAGIDMLVSVGILVLLFGIFTFVPYPTAVFVPLLLLIQLAFTLGVTMLLSAVTVYFRDIRHGLPILLQLGLFATPVAYGLDVVPEAWRPAYVAANPLGAVIEGYRRTVLRGLAPDWTLTGIAALAATGVLVAGYLCFKRLETGFADVA